uniref:Uncharacterized protein n=1 Tax=Globisporangium ultimum (strain ATCC 200006 / CBS 805.95 / DAOM BR144) TaxID=431595 RepID=K3X414_GLOUD
MTDAEVVTLTSRVTTKAQRQKQRRAAGTPYGVAGSRRSRHAAQADDDGKPQQRGGLFSRFLSYIPIVNQLVGDDDAFDGEEHEDEDNEFTDSDDGMQSVTEEVTTTTTTVDVMEETVVSTENKEEGETAHENMQKEDQQQDEEMDQQAEEDDEEENETTSSATKEASEAAHTISPKKPVGGIAATPERTASSPSSSKAPSTQSSASKSPTSAKRSRSRDVELGPVLRTQRRKNSSAQKAFLPIPSQKSKALRIGGHESPDDDMRRAHRRRQRLSGSPMDSPLAVIKHKRAISYEEYERLSLQLRGLVDSSPQTSLALTQNALARGFEDRPIGSMANGGSGKNLTYVPGSMTSRDNGRGLDLEKKNNDSNGGDLQLAVPYGKRARSNENRPIYFSGIALRGQMLTREERVERKPRPSRLLTGVKRDAAARSAYSSAVAEKILSTLNKVQNPLEREAKKPTPQTSLSWANREETNMK